MGLFTNKKKTDQMQQAMQEIQQEAQKTREDIKAIKKETGDMSNQIGYIS